MRTFILFFTLWSAIYSSHAQTYTPINNYGQQYPRIKVDKNLKVPVSSSYTRNTNSTAAGDIQVKTGTDTFLMYHSGAEWRRVIDSAYLAQHLAVVPSTSLLVTAATTLTLSGAYTDYIYTGSAPATWRLPPVSGNTGLKLYLKNRGAGNVRIITNAGGDDMFFDAPYNTVDMGTGVTYFFVNDGTYYNFE